MSQESSYEAHPSLSEIEDHNMLVPIDSAEAYEGDSIEREEIEYLLLRAYHDPNEQIEVSWLASYPWTGDSMYDSIDELNHAFILVNCGYLKYDSEKPEFLTLTDAGKKWILQDNGWGMGYSGLGATSRQIKDALQNMERTLKLESEERITNT